MITVVFSIALIILFAFIIGRTRNYAEVKGKASEKRVCRKLERLPKGYIVFNDLLFESNGKSVQIDHLVVAPYGIFVIETKGYSGWIFGSEDGQYWTKSVYGHKYKFYNPILQNAGHIRFIVHLLKEIGINDCFFSVIVFNNEATLKVRSGKSIVINRSLLKSAILSFQQPILTSEQCQSITKIIRNASSDSKDKKIKVKHKGYSQRRQIEVEYAERNGRCPRCGGQLILRQGDYGAFYGCSNYPRCRFTSKG